MISNTILQEFPFHDGDIIKIPIQVSSKESGICIDIEAVLDTGFNGFLQITFLKAYDLALKTTEVIAGELSDGRKTHVLSGYGFINFKEKIIPGMILVSPFSSDNLIGMQFLKELGGKSLILI